MKNYKILKNIYICLALLSTVLLVGCSKSDETPAPEEQPLGKGKITFNVHTPGAFLTRAVGVGDENGGTNDKIAFYQFSREGKYEQRYVLNYAAASVGANGDTRSYTVELTSSTGGEKRFIIVESENESNFPNMSATNTIDELLNSKTVAESGKLNPPFVMSNVKTDGKEYVTVADVESSNNQVDVKLKRRVARFDLLNDPTESGLVIDKVYIKNRYTQGFIGDVSGNAGNISSDVLEIPAADLANDGSLPKWLTISSSTKDAGSGLYRHEIIYTVTAHPEKTSQFAITHLNGAVSDENLLVIGFADPYPGTPLPCLSWEEKLYSPVHCRQSTYLVHNTVDKAYFCGTEGYTFNTPMKGKTGNEGAKNLCPEGWTALNDAEAKDYILWVGQHLKSQVAEALYTYCWFDKDDEATNLRILGGYPYDRATPNVKDLACYGTWPNVAWVNIKLPGLTIAGQTFNDEWTVKKDYGIPYRCIRDKAGWE